MKKLIAMFIAYVFTPVCLGGYALTHHSGFIFIYGLSCVIGVALYAFLLVLLCAMAVSNERKYNDLVMSVPKGNVFSTFVSAVYVIGGFSYLVYIEHFLTATLLLVMTGLAHTFRAIVRSETRKIIAGADKADLQKWLQSK